MTEVRFYHLERSSLDQVLPQLLTKALQTGQKILVKAPDANEVERLNEHLWTYDPGSFIPHGSAKDGFTTDQSVFLTQDDENPNGASILFLTHDLESPQISSYQLVCEIFDGRNEDSLSAARTRWKTYKQDGHALTYWQQGDKGWEKKD
jgi:DNA polymerase-3 subunit chi